VRARFDFLRWSVEAGADGFEHAYAVPDDLIPKIAEKKMSCVPTLAVLGLLGNQYEARTCGWWLRCRLRPKGGRHAEGMRCVRVVDWSRASSRSGLVGE